MMYEQVRDRFGEKWSVGWCRLYINDDGYNCIAIEGEIIALIYPEYTPDKPEYLLEQWQREDTWETDIAEFAKRVVPYYDSHHGYTDNELILKSMTEFGCAYCPLLEMCEAVRNALRGAGNE